MTKATRTPLEYHRGEDYAVVMRPQDTTDDALIAIRADTDEEADYWGSLIAAAPETAAERDKLKEQRDELLEALEKIAEYPSPHEVPSHTAQALNEKIAIARAAIARATGNA